jgi:hypothetical protein
MKNDGTLTNHEVGEGHPKYKRDKNRYDGQAALPVASGGA